MRARYMLNFTHAKYFSDVSNFWWNKSEQDIELTLSGKSQFVPFILKYVRNITSRN